MSKQPPLNTPAPAVSTHNNVASPTVDALPQLSLTAAQIADMAKFNITRKPVDFFHYRQFRYTTLAEAVAQAKRTE